MTTAYKVQDNWPLPPIRRRPRAAARKFPVDTMEVGGMFFVPGRTAKSVTAYVSRITKGLPGTFTTRRAWAVKDGDGWAEVAEGAPGAVEGVGVWRTA